MTISATIIPTTTQPTTLSAGAKSGTDAGATDGIFGLAEQKLAWLDTRQKLLAQNVANADTPGYKPRDVEPFSSVMNQFDITPARTSPLHMVALSTNLPGSTNIVSETQPDGNAVSLENEMTKVAQVDTSQQLVGNLWKTYMGMFMTALGKSG